MREGRLPQGALLYGSADELRPFSDKFELLYRAPKYLVSHPKPDFLNATTRDRVVGEAWLVRWRNASAASPAADN